MDKLQSTEDTNRPLIEQIRHVYPISKLMAIYTDVQETQDSEYSGHYMALCPFHPDRNPSLSINDQLGVFYCFGCQTGGDLFKAFMLLEDVPFFEAIRRLAEMAGLPPPTDLEWKQKAALIHIYAEALRHMEQHDDQHDALCALSAERKVSMQLLHRVQMVYVSESALRSARSHIGRDAWAKLDKAVSISQAQGYLIVPIRDSQGSPVGWAAKNVDDPQGPKYKNGPSSPLYNKSRHLLIPPAKATAEHRDITIVEGMIDWLRLLDIGWPTAALLGCALTAGHLRELNSMGFREIYIMLDGDRAGRHGVLKALSCPRPGNMQLNVCELEQGLDPDTSVDELGEDLLNGLKETAPSIEQWVLDWGERQVLQNNRELITDTQRLSKVHEEVTQAIHSVPDPLIRRMLEQQWSRILGLPAPVSARAIKQRTREISPAEMEATRFLILQRDWGPLEEFIEKLIHSESGMRQVSEARRMRTLYDDDLTWAKALMEDEDLSADEQHLIGKWLTNTTETSIINDKATCPWWLTVLIKQNVTMGNNAAESTLPLRLRAALIQKMTRPEVPTVGELLTSLASAH